MLKCDVDGHNNVSCGETIGPRVLIAVQHRHIMHDASTWRMGQTDKRIAALLSGA